MAYRVHKLNVSKDDARDELERFLNTLDGDVVSVVPYTAPIFQLMGATARVKYMLIVEKVE